MTACTNFFSAIPAEVRWRMVGMFILIVVEGRWCPESQPAGEDLGSLRHKPWRVFKPKRNRRVSKTHHRASGDTAASVVGTNSSYTEYWQCFVRPAWLIAHLGYTDAEVSEAIKGTIQNLRKVNVVEVARELNKKMDLNRVCITGLLKRSLTINVPKGWEGDKRWIYANLLSADEGVDEQTNGSITQRARLTLPSN